MADSTHEFEGYQTELPMRKTENSKAQLEVLPDDSHPDSHSITPVIWFQVILKLIFWGFGMFFFTYGKRLDETAGTGTIQILAGIGFFCSMIPFAIYYFRHITWHRVRAPHMYGFFAGVCSATGNIGYVRMTEGNAQASILAPITSCYLVIPVVVGIFFWKEPWSIQKLIGIGSACAAVLLLAFSPEAGFTIGETTNLIWFLTCFFTWGGSSIFYMMGAKISSITEAIMYQNLGFSFLTLVVAGIFYHSSVELKGNKSEYVFFFAGFLQGCGTNVYMVVARTYREASTISPLGSLYVILPVILGIGILGENVTAFKIIGIIITCVAILLLGTKDVRQLLFCINRKKPTLPTSSSYPSSSFPPIKQDAVDERRPLLESEA